MRQHGLSLIELLVAVTIGAILIFGATQVYVDSRNTYEINETAARLQETARYALSVIEPDIRMSNYWGLVKGAGVIEGSASQDEASAGAPTDCGTNFAHDLLLNLEGHNNTYGLACTPTAAVSGAVASADVLIVRRAAVATAAAGTGRLQVCSTRMNGELVTDSTSCTASPEGQINDLIVNAYYVSRDSSAGPPALRRKTLVAGPAFNDVEIIPGVEDLQIQFGVDPSGVNGVAQRYVDPDDVAEGEQIVAVRLWLLVRAEKPEVGFTDDRVYAYADRSGSTTDDLNDAAAAGRPYAPNDNFRRLLVSRTIQIRNALGT